MTQQDYLLQEYTADEGFVFDWKEPHYTTDEEGNQVQEHLNAKMLIMGPLDSIDNYIEIPQ